MENVLLSKVEDISIILNTQKDIILAKFKEVLYALNEQSKLIKEKESNLKELKLKGKNTVHEVASLKNQIQEMLVTLEEFNEIKNYCKSTPIADLFVLGKKTIEIDYSSVLAPAGNSAFKKKSFKSLSWGNEPCKKKVDFELSNSNKTMLVNYSSCWNFHFIEENFQSQYEESFRIVVENKGGEFTHHFIGFMNDAFYKNQSCACLYKPGFFFIHNNGNTVKMGSNDIITGLTPMEVNVSRTYEFRVRAVENQFDILVDDQIVGTVTLEGGEYWFCVGKCNSGKFEYTILD